MSHIAAALAKSKGKNVPPPPESVTGVPTLRIGPAASPMLKPLGATPALPRIAPSNAPIPAAVPVPAPRPVADPAPKRTMIAIVIALIVIIAGVSAWLWLKPDDVFASSVPPAPSAPPVAPRPKAAPAEIAPVRKAPSDALAEKVRLLPITAAAGGGSQRLSVGGKVYEPGETVTEGLVLQSIENEEIVFRDTEGNLYTRRL